MRIGTSGWSYDHWRGVLYGSAGSGRRLAIYSAEFDTVELNGSFYHWPRAEGFGTWRDEVPDGFLMSVKAPRGLTHARKLREPERWTERIRDGMAALGPHAGALLLQLPPDLERDDERLAAAVDAMPAEVTVAVELRHPSWVDDAVFALLEDRGASYCVMSGAQLPCELRATAELVYVRFHGPDPAHLYAGSYPDADLDWWADRIREWTSGGHSVVVYFNNDGEGFAVENARGLRARLA